MQIPQQSPPILRNNLMLAFFLMSLLLVISAGCDAGAVANCSIDVLVVTTTEDVSDGICGPEHCTLREAVEAINICNAISLTRIQLGEGTYELALRGAGDGRGDLDISQNMAIVGISPARTVISAASDWNDRIIHIGVATTVRLENLAIENGNSSDGPGGGIFNEGNLELDNVVLENNRAVYGAGLFNANEASLSSVEFFNNRAPGDQEIYLFTPDNFGLFASCGGGIANTGSMLISDGIVHENSAVYGSGICNGRDSTLSFDLGFVERNELTMEASVPRLGGGFYNQGTMSLSNIVVRNNSADSGGGIYSAAFEGEITLDAVFVSENEAGVPRSNTALEDLGSGGGLFLSGRFQISDSQIMDNLTHGLGGGLHIRNGVGGITNSSIGRNRAGAEVGSGGGSINPGRGGGFYVGSASGEADGTTLGLSNVTISSNVAGESGGAAYFRGGEASFINATIANNDIGRAGTSAVTGGIHLLGGQLIFQNSLLSFNQGECLIAGGMITSMGQNIEHNDSCGFGTSTDMVNVFPNEVILLDLVEIDGQWVHLLLLSGPAVDYIDLSVCPMDDQTGKTRPVGALCDVGAFEMEADTLSAEGAEVPLIPTPTGSSEPTATALTNASCRKGADAAHEVHNFLFEGQTALVVGRLSEATWVYVELPDELGRCWIFSENLDLTGPVDSLPLFPSPELPTTDDGGGEDDGGGDGGGNDSGGGSGGGSAPAAPSNASITNRTCDSEDYFFTIVWHDNANNEDGFRILRDGELIATVGPNVESYMYTPPGSGPYTFTIEAFNDNGSGETTVQEAVCFV